MELIITKKDKKWLKRNEFGLWGVRDGCFRGNAEIIKVVIEEGIGYIGDSAFMGCINLERVELPESMLLIKERAFRECPKLSHLVVPNDGLQIREYAFNVCPRLQNFCFRRAWKKEDAFPLHYFRDDSILCFSEDGHTLYGGAPNSEKDFAVPDGVEVIADDAFAEHQTLIHVIIPDGVTEIGARAFYNCPHLSMLEIPESVRKIGPQAFLECEHLKQVRIPGVNVEIADNAFPSETKVDLNEGTLVDTEETIKAFYAERTEEKYLQVVHDFALEVMSTNRRAEFPASKTMFANQACANAPIGTGIVRDRNGLPYLIFLTSQSAIGGECDMCVEMIASSVLINMMHDFALAGVVVNPWTEGGVWIPKPLLMMALTNINKNMGKIP